MFASLNHSKSRISLAILALLTVGIAAGQETNHAELARLAKKFNARAFADKADAHLRAARLGMPIRVDEPKGRTLQIMRFEGDRPVYYITDNATAAASIGTSTLWPGAISGHSQTGAGSTLRKWDGGTARATHQEFGGRVTIMDGGPLNFHATHVAGTMIASGVNPSAKGGAIQANLNSWDWDSDLSEMAGEASNGMQISNHSYGNITGWVSGNFGAGNGWYWWGNPALSATEDSNFGIYNENARDWDLVANAAPFYLPFKSAGNDRLQGPASQPTGWFWNGSAWTPNTVARNLDGGPNGFDSIGDVASAKNVMVIGAVNDIPGGWTSPSDVVMSSFSSWGPTDDGRIKPDLVANGVGLTSTWHTGNAAYDTISGTSMSTPSASGSAGTLARMYEVLMGQKMSAATLRGLLIGTADEAGPATGPDYMFGWGLMNTRRAADIIEKSTVQDMFFEEFIVSQGQTRSINIATDGEPFRIVLVWNDPAGPVATGAADDATPRLVNDMDLAVEGGNGGIFHYPWVLDPANPSFPATTGDNTRDNVEVVDVLAPVGNSFQYHVSHKGTLVGGSQRVSVIIIGAYNTDPFPASMVINPSVVKGGNPAQATYTLTGPAPAGGATIALSQPLPAMSWPNSIFIPEGQTSTSFTINTYRTPATASRNVIGNYNTFGAHALLTVKPPHVKTLTIAPNPQNGGANATGTVTLDVTAPPQGMTVQLSSSNPGAASVPASVVVAPGATVANFNVACGPVLSDTTVWITTKIEDTIKNASIVVLGNLTKFEVTSVVPTGAAITSGNLNSLKLSDDDYLGWKPLNASLKFIALDMLGTGETNLSQLNFTVEIKGTTTVDYKVEAYNFVKKAWIPLGTIPATTTDSSKTFGIASPNSFVNPSNMQLRSRVTASPHNGAPATWTSSVDQAMWTARR